MRLAQLKASKGSLTHSEERQPASGLHVKLAKKKQTAQLSGLLTEERLRGMTKRRTYYAVDTMFSFVSPF